MLALVLRRTLACLPMLWAIVTLVFLLMEVIPGEPFEGTDDPRAAGAAAGRLQRRFGTDRPLAERYASWLSGFASGDLGFSHSLREPVESALRGAMGSTLLLFGAALGVQFLLGIGGGVLAVTWRESALDRWLTALAAVVYAVPSYWLGVLFVWILSVSLGWLPASQMRSIDAPGQGALAGLWDSVRHLVLPVLSLALPAAAGIALYVRDELAGVFASGHIRGARARGLSRGAVILRHGLPNAMIPVANLMGLALPGLVGGSVVIEVLFAWPGMGRLAYQATLARDEPLVLGCVCVTGVFVILGSLVADLLTAAVDPRVREAR